MHPVTAQQLERLIFRIEKMLTELSMTRSLPVHLRLDDSYHMQKIEELKILSVQLREAEAAFDTVRRRVYAHYKLAYCAWRRDVGILTKLGVRS